MSEPHLEHQTAKVKDLIADYRSGRLAIPEFQRDYVWRKSKAPKLVDSLYQGFPISSLLVWQSSSGTKSRRADPRPARHTVMNWLIDGQQRAITLARTLSGDEGINVVFNPREEKFILANAATKNHPDWIPVSDIWDDEQFRRLRRNFDASGTDERSEASLDRVRRILDYEVPIVRMVDHIFEDAVKAFERINTLGVKLKKEDIESAQIAAKHSGFIAGKVVPFLTGLAHEGFNRINVNHLFRVCAFVAQPDGRSRTPLHELQTDKVSDAWNKTERATKQAIDIIKLKLGLVNMNILWSGALIVPIISLCATIPAKSRDSDELVGWLSLAAILHRYSGSSDTSLDQDLRACREDDAIGGLLKNLRQLRPDLTATPDDFAASLGDRGSLLALYIACRNRGIRDFYTGDEICHQRLVDRHHILPRSQFDVQERQKADNVSNIAFILGEANKSIGQTGPEVYLGRLSPKILHSQCIPVNSRIWEINRAEEFWSVRRKLLAGSFNEYVQKMLPHRRIGKSTSSTNEVPSRRFRTKK